MVGASTIPIKTMSAPVGPAQVEWTPPQVASLTSFRIDIEIHAREILAGRDLLNGLYAKHTGQPIERIRQDTERDNFMSPIEAKEYGLIDEILTTLKKPA